jgi:hypothetical protein
MSPADWVTVTAGELSQIFAVGWVSGAGSVLAALPIRLILRAART